MKFLTEVKDKSKNLAFKSLSYSQNFLQLQNALKFEIVPEVS